MASARESEESDGRDACQLTAAQDESPSSRCLAVRPALAHRLYSHRLHVRAKAKLHRDRLLSGPMIDIYVGAAKRRWTLHRNLLCHHSELLEAELEGDDDTLDLPDHDPAGFELLVKWLYQGTLDDVSDMPDANQKYEYAVSCHKLYLLCDRFDMSQLKNAAMDQYRKGLHEAELVPDADEIDDIYRKSPAGSPFRQLMTRIAARQIMDPASHRDVETYRQCLENNPDFALDLVKAIRLGTGGVLFDDPTEAGNKCEYHDHEAGPNCPVKGKKKAKQAQPDPQSAKPAPSTSSVRLLPPPPPRRPKTPPRPLPPRPARRPPGLSAGPLRRRITSPAISTVLTSMESVMATPSPEAPRDRAKDMERLRRVTPPDRRTRPPSQNGTAASPSAPDAHPPSSGAASHRSLAVSHEEGEEEEDTRNVLEPTPTRRGLWNWARSGTGTFNMMGRVAHPDWNDTPPFTLGATQDDFSLPSTTATHPDTQLPDTQPPYNNTPATLPATPLSFAQTKRSSDELLATASSTATSAQWTNGTAPETPTPPQRRPDSPLESDSEPTPTKDSFSHAKDSFSHAKSDSDTTLYDDPPTPAVKSGKRGLEGANGNGKVTPRRVATYKIALASRLMSPGAGAVSGGGT
ncbi:hypothetical protein P153DRAFT_295266 [Dothidotthia symphoricarpi CBS 119687]|uniref:BTB domain-containing protein n=1 Tax=Dothidotthia symphoricarpi CBS 119687 TaxID=1392245 RepID=A0A6A6A6E6_9PLEO|nr:uncharacterized protein P153DRAFT_295266 [Dothidotthia symphoricarpi CBS 119687]KAF2127552.1 hypothetical protein P153DRAFT_295266 [Dothidotthia symphoricarpi CBS 119687]